MQNPNMSQKNGFVKLKKTGKSMTENRHENQLPSEGFVFATSGMEYTTLARRAARTLLSHMPDASIDLFTSEEVSDPVFERIHRLDNDWFRPKMHALGNSRFDRTVVLDADIVVLAPLYELFDVLDYCDIAAVEAIGRRKILEGSSLPRSLPPVNSGVIAARQSGRLNQFCLDWEKEVRNSNANIDQIAFRELLYRSDLKYYPLGMEYNVILMESLDVWRFERGAPRILHVRELHTRPAGNPEEPITLDEVLGGSRRAHVENLLASELEPEKQLKPNPPIVNLRNRVKNIETTTRKDAGLKRKLHSVWKNILPREKTNATNGISISAASGKSISKYLSAVLALASQKGQLRICIVGANDGVNNDPIFNTIRNHLRDNSQLVLVEPQPYLLPILEENYKFHPDAQILNCAIGEGETLTLHAIQPDYWDQFTPAYSKGWPIYRAPLGVTSIYRENVTAWAKENCSDTNADIEPMVECIEVKSQTLSEVLQQANWKGGIDVLQVDAEGFDDEVIYSSNLDATRPSLIYFEQKLLGNRRWSSLRNHLEASYQLFKEGHDVLAIRKAGK
ncbi:hypothetical protein EY643_01725 [Halioglobus maricola]|uniref:Methyltransferase FkbM domain-containing protein n=1 Tax=Halioglobus maricola TaxID=2601894 RepID=A0A5P9NG04_9GAMM|nr:FkbM family methyltransferase [Halioglobus maricola]QFU74475.1 hypothetical protein EY643_01725 [Halioglobus maricola]